MRNWVLSVQLVMLESRTGEPVVVGSTVDAGTVRAVSDRLLMEADTLAEEAQTEDEVLGFLLTLDADKLRKTIGRLIGQVSFRGPRLVSEGDPESS